MKETLVILAAGMGSRYGGLKQIDGVGNHNEPIIEFTIFDAIKTGVIVPHRCGHCAWCRQSRKLTGPEMLGDIEEMEV